MDVNWGTKKERIVLTNDGASPDFDGGSIFIFFLLIRYVLLD
jgi:hypothetical protein